MGEFLTYRTELEQVDSNHNWITLHNQLFQDDDGTILLVPRYFETDGYTIDEKLAPVAGGRMQYDIRPAIGHDLECRYKLKIVVNLTIDELRTLGLLRPHQKTILDSTRLISVCEDIPLQYLSFEQTSFVETTKRMKRMMYSIDDITNFKKNMIASAVWLNIGWFKDKAQVLNTINIYKGII